MTCLKVLGKEASASVTMCQECLKFSKPYENQDPEEDSPAKISVRETKLRPISPLESCEDPPLEEELSSDCFQMGAAMLEDVAYEINAAEVLGEQLLKTEGEDFKQEEVKDDPEPRSEDAPKQA